jgi:hypothetical protein
MELIRRRLLVWHGETTINVMHSERRARRAQP